MEKFRSASVPHIKFESPRKPFPHFSIHTRVMQWGWKSSGKFALYFSALIVLSVLIPYTVGLVTGSIRPMLPLIRQSGVDSMRSGLSSIALFLTALIGSIMISVRYVHVSSQNETRNWRLNLLNKLGLAVGYVSFIGLVIVASFPVSVTGVQHELWVSSVFIVHMMGAFFAFFFGATYLLLQTAISLFFYEGSRRIVLIRFTIFLACTACFVTSTLTTISVDKNNSGDLYFQSGVISKFITEPNLLASVCEWFLVFFFALYFLTFVRESESISAVITFRQLITGRRISIASLTNMSKI